jgi:hypothetical protein
MSSLFVFVSAWCVLSLVTAYAAARVMGFAARKDSPEPEMLAAYGRRRLHLALVYDRYRDQRRA